jgi:hypothetical protein
MITGETVPYASRKGTPVERRGRKGTGPSGQPAHRMKKDRHQVSFPFLESGLRVGQTGLSYRPSACAEHSRGLSDTATEFVKVNEASVSLGG